MNAISYVIGFGILQAFLLAGLLVLVPRTPRLPNLFMAGLVLAISGRLLHGWLTVSGNLAAPPAWTLPIGSLTFTWGPLLYLYAYTMTRQHVSWVHSLHFLPWLAILLLIFPFYHLSPEQQQLAADYLWYGRDDATLERQFQQIANPFYGYWIEYRFNAIAFVLQFSLYCVLVLQRIRQHNKFLQSHFSSLELMNLRWLRILTGACLAYIFLLLLLNRLPQMLFGGEGFSQGGPYIFLVLIIYMIVVAALFQPSIIRGVMAASEHGHTELPTATPASEEEEEKQKEAEPVSPAKYTRSGIALEDAQRYKLQLMDVTRRKQLFLDSELTLPELATAAGITPHQVSQVLNGQLGQNFFTFINNYRIKYAKELMADTAYDHLAIVDLAFEVGFKSKSSFYKAFKKATNVTPAQYRKTLRSAA
jgi:AraC-like DNA-binding protein